jgi:hypothetical protein
LVSGNAELAALADGDDVALCVDDLGFGMGHDLTDGCKAAFDAIGG